MPFKPYYFFHAATTKPIPLDKLDAPLRLKISELEKSNNPEMIQVLAKCNQEVSESILQDIKHKNIVIENVLDKILVLSGSSENIKRLAAFDFIDHIELSTEKSF